MPNQEALYFKVCVGVPMTFSVLFFSSLLALFFYILLKQPWTNKPHFQVEFALHVNPSEWQNQSFPIPPFFDLT